MDRINHDMQQCGCQKLSITIPSRFAVLGDPVQIGYGANSIVYKMCSTNPCVIKTVSCKRDEPFSQDVALHEIRIMERLRGVSQTVQLLDYEYSENRDGKVYLLEEYVEPYANSFPDGFLDPDGALALIENLCAALIACRTAGVYHLDIQPKNIFRRNGSLVLGDFGSSLFCEELPSNKSMRGTLAFMAPEVYREGRCSEQSEIYSAGIMLFCLFNQHMLPFIEHANKDVAIFQRLAGKALPRINYPDEKIGLALNHCIKKACVFDPEMRFSSFEQLLAEIHELRRIVRQRKAVAQKESEEISCCAAPLFFDADPIATSVALSPLKFDDDSTATTVLPSAGDNSIGSVRPSSLPNSINQSAEELAAQVPEPSFKDSVQFSAVAPQKLIPGKYFPINIVIYEDGFRNVVDAILQAQENAKEKMGGYHGVERNSKVKVVLSSPEVSIDEATEEQIWEGKYLNFEFDVKIPSSFSDSQILFRAKVYIDNVLFTCLKLTVDCERNNDQVVVSRSDIISAFVSYASQDRNRVASIIQGIQKVRPDMDVFFDVESLRSGEDWEAALRREIDRRDILYLCWSQNAKRSKWVDAEWRYALSCKGIDGIEPIPIERPDICPPPEELSKLHFNDRLLFIINA